MHEHHPLLANILALARAETWASADLSDRAIVAWLRESDRCDWTRVYFVGCGTSLYAGQVGECVVEHLAHLPAKAVPGFAFAAYAEPALLGPEALVVGISATGNTEAVVNALARASQADASTLALTADAGSKVTEVADATIPVRGPLTTSVKTRSYVQTLAALYRMALRLARAGREDEARTTDRWQEQIVRAADVSRRFLGSEIAHMEELATPLVTITPLYLFGYYLARHRGHDRGARRYAGIVPQGAV